MTDITITLGNRPDLDPEERRLRALRAQEVLAGAGWAFDEVISGLTRDLIDTPAEQPAKRETLYYHIDAAIRLKDHLRRVVTNHEAELKANERKHRDEPLANHE
jgi:hypothetical protein